MIKTVNIFSPTYHRLEKTKKSINSLIESVNQSKNDVNFFIGDNNSPPEMKEWLKSLVNDKVKIFLCEKNIGKAAIVNYMHGQVRDSEYFVSVDSDMLATHNHEYNWIDCMVEILSSFPPLGVVSAFQEGNNCHALHTLHNSVMIKTYKILHGHFGGVAGGCFMMRNRDFNQIGKYTVYDVYNGDDAFIMRKTFEQLGKMTGVVENIKLEHIANDPEEAGYQAWKLAKAFGNIPNGEGTKGFYDG